MSSDFPTRFAQIFASLDKTNLSRVGEIYTPDVHFTDPLHEVHGLRAMQAYFGELYANVEDLQFEFHQCQSVTEGQGLLRWTMTYRHPRLAGGGPISVEGCSCIYFRDDLVYRHIDYFDAGALLYEHVPLLGKIIRWLKGRLA
ncbi:nuclear transport factor 2 family protein [Halopseudomonas salina]|uniref:Transcriptional regulator n=1 Tax=Halopseudomonas salina TaxID=1323744 RepID=A0ABQ1Q3X2_9GAMM|nr:nuclear transport factor 2 family protein [Halopseudomonas salina]GGD11542.1 transcriptional regulator [Halopseudomonas salina]